MVKILQAYNFAAQDTFALNGEFLAATLINTHRIAISSADQFIEIYDIESKQRPADKSARQNSTSEALLTNGGGASDGGSKPPTVEGLDNGDRLPSKYSLATVGEVVNLMYCEAGKYLLTLEKENVGSPVHSNSTSISCTSSSNSAPVYSEDDTKLFVRIYANFWKFPEEKLIDLPIVIRIASMTTPKAPLVENIDVIELPMRSPPDLIQCCQTSGNIIVSSKERIYLYEYTQCTHENTQPRFSYIDFLPFKFFVTLNFVPLRLCLAENVIACMNNRYCVAFKVVDTLSAAATAGAAGQGSEEYGHHEFYANPDGGEHNAEADVVSTSESSMASRVSGGGPSSRNSFETDSLETTSSGGVPLVGVAGLPGRTPVDFNVARMVNSACGRGEFEVELKSQWDQPEAANTAGLVGSSCNMNFNCSVDTQEIVITPTRASEIKIKLVNEAKAMNVQRIPTRGADYAACHEDTSVQYDIRKLLQICMKTSEPSERVLDILRCMDLRAIYQRSPDGDVDDLEYDMGNQQIPGAVSSSKHLNRRTLKSGRHHSCVGYALLVASSVDGYLYQFCAQGKWYNENEKPIATYSFTAPVLRVHINDYVIYAVTTESVETHTSRIGHKLFNNRFEYPTIGGLFPEESSPDVNAAIAVIGLCSFMQVQFVCVSRDNLILISSSTLVSNGGHCADLNVKRRSGGGAAVVEVKRNIAARLLAEAKAKHSLLRSSSHAAQAAVAVNEWTLYKLALPAVESVVDDLEGIAETYRVASSSNFYDLMEEAHVMLRLSLSLQCELLTAEREHMLRMRFMENCRKLADFSIRSKNREVYLQAAGFYKMCNLQLPEIYGNYVANATTTTTPTDTIASSNDCTQAHNAEQLVGLLYTVKLFLLSLGSSRLKATFLNQLVKPFFTVHRNREHGSGQVPLSLELLHMFVQYAPADVPPIMLQSPVVADNISGELINYLKFRDNLNDEENLLLAVTACRMSNYMLSQEIVSKSGRRNLATALIKYKNVLFDDGTVLFQKPRSEAKLVYNARTAKKTVAGHCLRRQQPRKAAFGGQQQRSQGGGCSAQVSFSDFTETILLATENTELIEAVSDAFIHALCVEHSIGLDTILQLFLNYIASHIGQKGYQTSQKVFVNVLQVYFYDYYDVCTLIHGSGGGGGNELHSHTPPQLEDDYDEASSKVPSLNSERDNDSIGETNSGGSSSVEEPTSGRNNRIVYDQLLDQHSPFKRGLNFSPQHQADVDAASQADSHEDEANLKGLKILFRMYLGRMKALSDLLTDLQSADIEQQSSNEEFLSLRMECIKFMLRYLHEMRLQQQQQSSQQAHPQQPRFGHKCYSPPTTTAATATGTQFYYAKATGANQSRSGVEGPDRKLVYVPYIPDYKMAMEEYERHIKAYVRPIPCLLERPQYLNRLPPFKRTDFSYPNADEGETDVHFLGWHNELLTLTLKIQSLLASPRIDREIVEEFIAFIQKAPDLIGIDSFLVIVLPKNLAINYMMNFCPEHLWPYGKSNGFTPRHWESLLRKMLSKQDLLPNWKENIKEILNNLVAELSFEELLQCFPNEVIQQRDPAQFLSEYKEHSIDLRPAALLANDTKDKQTIITDGAMKRDHLPMDNIDEANVFELTLRKAVAKQRSIALRSMIESTGTQLFDVTSNPMYNL